MFDKTDILEYLRRNKIDFFAKYHLSKLGIFGSYARGEQTPSSDIDIIIEFKDINFDIFEIKNDLRSNIEAVFGTHVDICREKYIKPYYKKVILKDAIFV